MKNTLAKVLSNHGLNPNSVSNIEIERGSADIKTTQGLNLPPPDIATQKKFILGKLARIQPATFQELLDVTGYPELVLAERLDELLTARLVTDTRGVSRSYYAIQKSYSL